jgi:GNAT superfamily N-acetyltransferase
MKESGIENFPVTVEPAKPEDAETLAKFLSASISEQGEVPDQKLLSKENIQALADMAKHSNEQDYYLIARHSGAAVGMSQMTWRSDAMRFAFRRLYVAPDYRNKHVAAKLFSAAEGKARHSTLVAKGIELYVEDVKDDQKTSPLIDMYEKWGFQQAGRNESEKWTKMILDF